MKLKKWLIIGGSVYGAVIVGSFIVRKLWTPQNNYQDLLAS